LGEYYSVKKLRPLFLNELDIINLLTFNYMEYLFKS